MSDTSFTNIMQNIRNIDAYDDEWILDQLSDDEIDIPSGVEFNDDEEDEEYLQGVDPDDVWDDLGLEKFNIDLATNITIDPPTTSNVTLNANSTSNNQLAGASNANSP